MASKKIFGGRSNYIYPAEEMTNKEIKDRDVFEFDESDVWDAADRHFSEKTQIPSSRILKKTVKMADLGSGSRNRKTTSSSSLPVNVPDWSKILKEEYRKRGKMESDDDVDSDADDVIGGGGFSGGGVKDPPHEYLARRRGDSLSVLEGAGRTLKGRDLSRVRNAILKQTGFLD